MKAEEKKSQKKESPAVSLMELGRLYKERADFGIAIEKFRAAGELWLAEKNFEQYLECLNHLLRMYAERQEYDKIVEAKERLQDLVLKEGFQPSSRTYYSLGICATYKDQYDVALDYFQKALATALAADDKRDMCYAIHGIATVYFLLERYDDSLKEILNLQVFFQFLNISELKVSSSILNGLIFRNLERYDQALEILWQTYDQVRETKNLSFYLNLLYAIGTTYQRAGETELSRVYLQLAKRSGDPVNLKDSMSQIDQRLEELGVRTTDDYDLIFDPKKNEVMERKKGKLDFRNQFILLDLLHLFMKNPGRVFGKEELVKKVWGQEYDPAVHDNKIYVTIKRLRQLIEPDYDKPRYIFRAKQGYYLNKSTKVRVEN